MKHCQFTFCTLVAVVVLTAGCFFLAHHPDPLAGWKRCWSQDPNKLDKTVRDDYQDYIQKLSPEERKFVGAIHLFEDGTGRTAVRVEVNLSGTRWAHVLIYDAKHNRSKVIKYVSGRYMS